MAATAKSKKTKDKRVKTVRLIWLEAFVAVAQTGSYKDAGLLLDLDPTVINKYIKSLEEWLSKSLLLRFYKNPKITADGEEFLAKAKTIIELLHTSRDFHIDASNSREMTQYVSQFYAQFMHKKAANKT